MVMDLYRRFTGKSGAEMGLRYIEEDWDWSKVFGTQKIIWTEEISSVHRSLLGLKSSFRYIYVEVLRYAGVYAELKSDFRYIEVDCA